MDNVNCKVQPYSLRVKGTDCLKKGYVLSLLHEGVFISGDISPLKGYSTESIQNVESELSTLIPFINTFGIENAHSTYASTAFALVCIKSKIQNKCVPNTEKKQVSLHVIHSKRPVFDIKETNCKVKFSRGITITEVFFPKTSIHFRIDFQERYKLEDIIVFLQNNPHLNIEYIEDAVSPPLIQSFQNMYNIPCAIDLRPSHDIKKIVSDFSPFAVIIKPSLIHNFDQAIAFFHNNGIKVSLSSLFESRVGLDDIKLLSTLYNCSLLPGIGTLPHSEIRLI